MALGRVGALPVPARHREWASPEIEGGGAASASGEQDADWRSAIGSFARRARAAVTLPGPLMPGESLMEPLAAGGSGSSNPRGSHDEEMGDREPRFLSWARQAQQGLQEGLVKATSVDWSEQVGGVQNSVAQGFERVTESASSATAALQDRVSQGVERAKSLDLAEQARGVQRGMSRSLESVAANTAASTASLSASLQESQVVQKAKDNAAAAAGAVRGSLSVAGERVAGAATIATTSPATLAQFAAVFGIGCLFVLLSLNFLPVVLLFPQKFASFFTMGSVTILCSFMILSGPEAFLKQLMKKHRRPFSAAYICGLVGTLWATIIKRSTIFTAIFAVMQALALLYFVCSFLPGGTQFLNLCGVVGRRSVRALAQN